MCALLFRLPDDKNFQGSLFSSRTPRPLLEIQSLWVWSRAGNVALYFLSDLPCHPQFRPGSWDAGGLGGRL